MKIRLNDIKQLCLNAWPLVAAFLAQKGIQIVDTLMLGWLGPDALAAAALANSCFLLIVVFCMGSISAVGIYIVGARGSHQPLDIKHSLQSGMYLAVFLSLLGMLVIWQTPRLLEKLGQNPHVVANTRLFLHGLVWGLPGFLLFLVYREFLAAFELASCVLAVCLLSIPLTFCLNYLLITGLFGLPKLGISGIGYAGALVQWFMFLSLFIYSKKHLSLNQHLPKLVDWRISYAKIFALFRLGLPSGIILVLDVSLFASAALMIGHFGVEPLAAYQISMQCGTVAYAIPVGLSMATALQVSHARAANNLTQAKNYAYTGLFLGLSITALIALLFIFFPNWLIGPFLDKDALAGSLVYYYALDFLAIVGLFQCFDALQVILNGALKGFKDTFIPMLLCIVCYWIVGMGMAYYLAFYTSLAAKGVWYGLTLGIFSAALVLVLRFRYKTKAY